MGRLTLIVILVSPAVAFCAPEKEPGIQAGPSRALLTITAAGEANDGIVYGECPSPEPEDPGDRRHGAISTVLSMPDNGAVRGGPSAFPKHGLGPVLSSLSDSLILSRPPPAASARA